MKRIFDNQSDCDLYKAVAFQDATVDRRAYSFIENQVFWLGFKAYLKKRFNYDYDHSLEAIDYHQYAGDFQATINRYVSYKGRVLFWKITDTSLEPDVWEFEATDLVECMVEWDKLCRMSLFDLIRWYRKKKNN
ncbi:MAG: hypothetical protein AABN95_00285 [Acidobacteriota bacterium]